MNELIDTVMLRTARLRGGFSERGLARLVGTTALRIRRLEAGVAHRSLTLGMLVDLAAALDVHPAELLHPDAPTPAPLPQDRALNLPEARLLRRALYEAVPLTARGLNGVALARLITTGTLVATRADPHQTTTIRVAADIVDALDLALEHRPA